MTIHWQFLCYAAEVLCAVTVYKTGILLCMMHGYIRCIMVQNAIPSPPLHHTHQSDDLTQNLYVFCDDGFHGIVLRLETVMSVLLIKTFDSG